VYPARRLAEDGLKAWAQVVERGYEGLVAKDEASSYESGRTTRWLKVKQKDWTVEEDRWRRTISVAPPRDMLCSGEDREGGIAGAGYVLSRHAGGTYYRSLK